MHRFRLLQQIVEFQRGAQKQYIILELLLRGGEGFNLGLTGTRPDFGRPDRSNMRTTTDL